MRVVTGGKYPATKWIVVDEDDNVIFEPPRNTWDMFQSLKLCNIYVNMPEHRDELQEVYGLTNE